MAREKVSLTLDDELVAEARRRSGRQGLSSYVNLALRRQLQYDRLSALLNEMEGTAGPVPVQVIEEVRREWPEEGRPRRARGARR